MLNQIKRLLVGALLAVLLFAPCFTVTAFAAGKTVATLIGVRGGIQVKRFGDSRFVGVQSEGLLYYGDVVRASADGYASILFADGSQAKLKSGATIQITKEAINNTGQSFFKALVGVIWAHMNPNSTIETPTANIIVRGTDILISVANNGEVTLIVLSGEAILVTNAGEVIVTSGEESSVSGVGGVPSAPVPVDVSGLDDWTYLNVAVPSEGVTEQVDPYTGVYTPAGTANFNVPLDSTFDFAFPAIFIPALPVSYIAFNKTPTPDNVPSSTPAPEINSGVDWLIAGILMASFVVVVHRRKAISTGSDT